MYLYITASVSEICLTGFRGVLLDANMWRHDLINSKGKALVTAARLGAVWKRLSECFKTVVVDTFMITLSNEYSIHFHDLYIDGKENSKMPGDWMKMLMLMLPFMVLDLITPEVLHYMYWYVVVCTVLTLVCTCYVLVCTRLIWWIGPSRLQERLLSLLLAASFWSCQAPEVHTSTYLVHTHLFLFSRGTY